MKSYIVWLTHKRQLGISASCFAEAMVILTRRHDESEIKRIYCEEDDCSLVIFRNTSSRKKGVAYGQESNI